MLTEEEKSVFTEKENKHNIWRSYSDMMAGLLLLFVLIMGVALVTQQQLNEKLEIQIAENEELSAELDERQRELADTAITLDEREAIIQVQLQLIAEQQSELDAQKEEIEKVIGIKATLIATLQREFENRGLTIDVDGATGALILSGNVLFGYKDSELSDEGKAILDELVPIYLEILTGEDYGEYLAQILIEGFADSVGSYESNMGLAEARAASVGEYLYTVAARITAEGSMSGESLAILEETLTVCGRSSSNLILDEDGNEDSAASRRVEIKFRLKDEEMLDELLKLLEE